MIILSIDSSTPVASVAVVDEDKILGEFTLNTKNTHSEKLMGMIVRVLDDLALAFDQVDVIAVAQGPGSFTGLRIGMATAKALAQGGSKKLITIPSLEGLAYNVVNYQGVICPILNAKKHEVYTALYHSDNGLLTQFSECYAINPESLLDRLAQTEQLIWFLGDGVSVYCDMIKDKLGKQANFVPAHHILPRASSIGLLAMERAKQGQFDDFFSCQPLYIRKSEAELQWEAKQAKLAGIQ